jgi:hypothetical protein
MNIDLSKTLANFKVPTDLDSFKKLDTNNKVAVGVAAGNLLFLTLNCLPV